MITRTWLVVSFLDMTIWSISELMIKSDKAFCKMIAEWYFWSEEIQYLELFFSSGNSIAAISWLYIPIKTVKRLRRQYIWIYWCCLSVLTVYHLLLKFGQTDSDLCWRRIFSCTILIIMLSADSVINAIACLIDMNMVVLFFQLSQDLISI